MRVLIVSGNDALVNNVFVWFKNDIARGSLVVDHARTKDDAEIFLKEHAYDKIVHNGIWIIREIENYQRGAEVFHYGDQKNDIFKNHIDVSSKDGVKKIFRKRYLPFRVSIGQAVTTTISLLVFLSSVIVFAVSLRSDVDHVVSRLNNVETSIKAIDDKVQEQKLTIISLDSYIRAKDEIKEKLR